MYTFFTTGYDFIKDRNDVVEGEAVQFNMSFDENGAQGVTFIRNHVTERQWLTLLNRAQNYFTVYGV